MARWVAAVLGAGLAGNALAMLLAGPWWYEAVPGVIETGPYNAHLVRDVGAAYLVTAAGLAAFAWRPVRFWPALVGAAGFLTLHAGIHVYDSACGTAPLQTVLRDLPGVYLPALIALVLSFAKQKDAV